MHLALIKCAASLLFVISGRSGARIKSAVRLQILSFLGLQSIAFLPHSIPYSASSFLKSPLTIAALTGPENDARWWESHNHQSHCSCFYCVCVHFYSISVYVESMCTSPAVSRVCSELIQCLCVCISVGVWCNVTSVKSFMDPHRLCVISTTPTHIHVHYGTAGRQWLPVRFPQSLKGMWTPGQYKRPHYVRATAKKKTPIPCN